MSKAKELSVKYKNLLNKNGMNTTLRLASFWAQLHHESNLKPISENLNYSVSGLLKTFGKYFTKDTKDKDGNIIFGTASLYSRKPEKIANKVYANRMGNGDETSGDGWKYRGRGFIQITGKDNYKQLSKDTGIDYVTNPDNLLTEADALISALWYFSKNNLNRFSDKDDIKGLTKAINGGYNGLAHRTELTAKYKKEFA